MNLREHLSRPKYYTAILLTYNIDPVFFENIILRDLHLSNISDILVICDKSQKKQLLKYAGNLKSLGKKYILETANSNGRFHPKIFIKIGYDATNLTIGSSNLSPGGWGNNFELCSSIEINKDDIEGCKTISNIINGLKEYIQNENVLELINNIFEKYNWLNENITDAIGAENIIITPQQRPLIELLRERILDTQYESLTILTGSTDESGAFIQECIKSFGIHKFNIYLTPSYSRFNEASLNKLNAEINIFSVEDKYIHSKFYYFQGSDPFAIIGSANCSRAAWLIPPIHGGNVESIAFLNSISDKELALILDSLPHKQLKFNEICTWGIHTNNGIETDESVGSNHLISVTYDSSKTIITVCLKNMVDLTSELLLKYEGQYYQPLERVSNQSLFDFFVDYKPSLNTQFAETIVIQGKNKEIYEHWIDDINQLKYLNKGTGLYTAFNRLTSKLHSSELDSLRKDIESIKNMILNGDLIFDDSNVIINKSKQDNKIDDNSHNILTPKDLTAALVSKSSFNEEIDLNFHQNKSISLFGIERIFFGADKYSLRERTVNDKDIDDDQPLNRKPNDKPDGDDPKETAKFIKRTEKLIDKLIEGMGKDSFANKCTVLQLSQAISFPLALSYLGYYKLYFNINQIEKWFYDLLNILFFHKYSKTGLLGLLNFVKEKYILKGKTELFDNTIGNGIILILVELIACNIYDNLKNNRDVSIIFYLNTLINNDFLTSSTDLKNFDHLVNQAKFEEMQIELLRMFPLINNKLDELEIYMLDNFTDLVTESSYFDSKDSEIIYGKKFGWGITNSIYKIKNSSDVYWNVYFPTIGESRQVLIKGFYINLNSIIVQNKDLNHIINDIFV